MTCASLASRMKRFSCARVINNLRKATFVHSLKCVAAKHLSSYNCLCMKVRFCVCLPLSACMSAQVEASSGECDETAARRAWEAHLLRNDSFVVDTMHGQYKSVRSPASGMLLHAYNASEAISPYDLVTHQCLKSLTVVTSCW